MKAIVVTDEAAGTAGMKLTERPGPEVAGSDVVVEALASKFTPGGLSWRGTWIDRFYRVRPPSTPDHEMGGVVSAPGS